MLFAAEVGADDEMEIRFVFCAIAVTLQLETVSFNVDISSQPPLLTAHFP